MGQKAATVLIENVVAKLLQEWQSRFNDLQYWWQPETSTTFVLYLVSEQFEDIFADELQSLRDELRFALEAETGYFWKVIMLTPEDVRKIRADLKKNLKQLTKRLKEHAQAFEQLANRVLAAEVTSEEYDWRDWLVLADRLVGRLKDDAKRFYERFLLYRGWNDPEVEAVQIVIEFQIVSELMKFSAQCLQQITRDLKFCLQQKTSLKEGLSAIATELRVIQDALLKVVEVISGGEPDIRTLRQKLKELKMWKKWKWLKML